MENEQIEYTVEYQDSYGVVYFENVKALSLSDAKIQVHQRIPEANIRAVTAVSHANEDESR
ncbi:hypothetical protein ACE6ED_19080 [Paenibacillus sp. CN-4]|uniref:hypothetical protein n=1 Tax=Paenibacillus nanchangensis TaxID=3348343 RepID=UPI00397D9AC8